MRKVRIAQRKRRAIAEADAERKKRAETSGAKSTEVPKTKVAESPKVEEPSTGSQHRSTAPLDERDRLPAGADERDKRRLGAKLTSEKSGSSSSSGSSETLSQKLERGARELKGPVIGTPGGTLHTMLEGAKDPSVDKHLYTADNVRKNTPGVRESRDLVEISHFHKAVADQLRHQASAGRLKYPEKELKNAEAHERLAGAYEQEAKKDPAQYRVSQHTHLERQTAIHKKVADADQVHADKYKTMAAEEASPEHKKLLQDVAARHQKTANQSKAIVEHHQRVADEYKRDAGGKFSS